MNCPHCDLELIPPVGPEDALLFIAGEAPGDDETRDGVPISGQLADMLKQELLRWNKVPLRDTRRGNLWLHAKSKTCDFNWHLEQFLVEAGQHQYIFLMGAGYGKGVLYNGSVKERMGTVIEVGGVSAVIAPSIGSIKKESVGEFRFALQKLAEVIQ